MPMEAKGVGVLSLQEYVKQKHTDQYEQWLEALPPSARKVMGGRVLPSSWYSMREAMIAPMDVIVRTFHRGDTERARLVGRFGAEFALSGFYKLLVKVGTPGMLINRSAHYMSLYYRPSTIDVVKNTKGEAVIRISRWPEPSDTLEISMCGWVQCALEISGCKDVSVVRQGSIAWGDAQTDMALTWR